MDELNITLDSGSFTIFLSELSLSKTIYVYVRKCYNLFNLINEIKTLVQPYNPGLIYLMTKEETNLDLAFTVDTFMLRKIHYKSDKNYKLIKLDYENRDGFISLANEIYTGIQNFKGITNREVIDMIRNNVDFGYITFKKEIVGLYSIIANQINLFGIKPCYQRLGYGLGGMKKVINRVDKDVIINIASSNKKAFNLLNQMKFEKLSISEKWYLIG